MRSPETGDGRIDSELAGRIVRKVSAKKIVRKASAKKIVRKALNTMSFRKTISNLQERISKLQEKKKENFQKMEELIEMNRKHLELCNTYEKKLVKLQKKCNITVDAPDITKIPLPGNVKK